MTVPLMPQSYPVALRDRLQFLVRYLRRIVDISMMTFLTLGPGRIFRWYDQRKMQRGEKMMLQSQYVLANAVPTDQRAQITPKTNGPSRKSKMMKQASYPKPVYPFAFRTAPLSGNIINGLGETTKRQPNPIFFHVTGQESHGWDVLEQYLMMSTTVSKLLRPMVYMQWIGRESTGPLASDQQPVADPQEMTAQVKATARALGAILVGITELKSEHIFAGGGVPYRYAISCAVPMDREVMLHAPSQEAVSAIFDAYAAAAVISTELAKRIRALGWGAVSTSTVMDKAEIAHIPIAVDAGLGQLGKHGSLITEEYGSNVRLGTVLTNLPLAVDHFTDIGVDDFCTSCQICTTNCPPQAIFDTKQMVRGEEKWFVDFDTCVPYFVSNHSCAICIEVCPWSEEGRGASISQKMLAKRAEKNQQHA